MNLFSSAAPDQEGVRDLGGHLVHLELGQRVLHGVPGQARKFQEGPAPWEGCVGLQGLAAIVGVTLSGGCGLLRHLVSKPPWDHWHFVHSHSLGTSLRALSNTSPPVAIATLGSRCHWTHFTDEETDVQRSKAVP